MSDYVNKHINKIITPDDPEWHQPLVMSDPYDTGREAKHLTPKTAQAKRTAEFDDMRDKEGSPIKYATSQIAVAPDAWVKGAQSAGVSNMMTQPMWFSPLHTPQNWQIASKRREIYQWSFISGKNPCFLVNYSDFSLINISDVYTKWQNDFRSRDQMYIQNNKGEGAKIDLCTKRRVSKKANRIKALGQPHAIEVTNDHDCIILRRKDVKCIKGGKNTSKNCISDVCSPTCIGYKCNRFGSVEYPISKVKARDVKKGDYLLSPFPTEIKESVIKTENEARFAGHLASDGCVSKGQYGVRLFMNPIEFDYVLNSAVPIFESFGAKVTPKMARDGSNVATIRSGKKEFHRFAASLVQGSKEEKKYTEEVMLLCPKLQKHVLGAYIQSDGSFNKKNEQVEITTVSKHLANQVQTMLYRCGILAFCSKQPVSSSDKTFHSKSGIRYLINIPKTFVHTLKEYCPGKIPSDVFVPKSNVYTNEMSDTTLFEKPNKQIRRIHNRFFWKNYVVTPVVSNTCFDYDGDVFDVRVPPTYAVTANGIAIHQCRFFFENEPKVGAAIDFYCFTPDTPILMADGEQKSIRST